MGGGRGRPGGFPRAPAPSTPPTVEAINALAKKEHVPARIAKGELEGKMKCRVWRKLHAEEARRFDQVYALMDKHPGLELADGFGALQSGLTVEEFLAKKARTQKKAQVKEARNIVSPTAINALVEGFREEKTELSVVLGDKTLLDVLEGTEKVAFQFQRSGRVEKLQVVVMARRSDWDKLSPTLERDAKLTQKPLPIARQPEKRPVSDPRPFEPLIGKPIKLLMRNGLILEFPLLQVGPFDLLLGAEGSEIFVPLHAITRVDATPT